MATGPRMLVFEFPWQYRGSYFVKLNKTPPFDSPWFSLAIVYSSFGTFVVVDSPRFPPSSGIVPNEVLEYTDGRGDTAQVCSPSETKITQTSWVVASVSTNCCYRRGRWSQLQSCIFLQTRSPPTFSSPRRLSPWCDSPENTFTVDAPLWRHRSPLVSPCRPA